MELSQFVRESLSQIIKGVGEARQSQNPDSGVINPKPPDRVSAVVHVRFDVSIVTTDTKEGGGKLSVVAANMAGKISSENTSTSRIQFVVPVELPSTDVAHQTYPPSMVIPPSGEISRKK